MTQAQIDAICVAVSTVLNNATPEEIRELVFAPYRELREEMGL